MCYCGEVGEKLSNILCACFRAEKDVPDWPQFRGKDVIFTHQGKIAIALACSLWNIKRGDHILVPSYNCGSEIDPLFATGATIEPYQVDSKAQINIKDVLHRITPQTKLIYVTHYFGWPQNIEKIVAVAKNLNIKVLEDCALSLFSSGSSFTPGLLGDAAIYSFPKSLAVPDGGALVSENLNQLNTQTRHPPITGVVKKILPLLKRNGLRRLDRVLFYNALKRVLRTERDTPNLLLNDESYSKMPESYYYDCDKKDLKQSRVTQGLLNKVVVEDVIRRRRKNYEELSRLLKVTSMGRLLFPDLPPYICPLALPIITTKRNMWCQELNRLGITAIPWWAGQHKAIDFSTYKDAQYLKNNLLVLPVHQDLRTIHIEYIASSVRKLMQC